MTVSSAAQTYADRIYEVPGFFGRLDAALFARLFEVQNDVDIAGDVLEIGCFYGRSAILLELLRGEEEVFHVCDLFEHPPPTKAGRMELAASSSEQMPTRAEFEAWFRSYHSRLPVIHQMPSRALSATELGSNQFRFVHIDGSHTYEVVTQDIAIACEVATEGAVLVFDDFANVGHPGVAAALWPAVVQRRLKPFAASPSKLYVTLGSDWADRYREALEEFAVEIGHRWKLSELLGGSMLSIWPIDERRSLGARVAGRVRRSLRRTYVHRSGKQRRRAIRGLHDLILGIGGLHDLTLGF